MAASPSEKPTLKQIDGPAGTKAIAAAHPVLVGYHLYCEGEAPLLFTEITALGVWSWDIPQGRIRLSEQVGKSLPETPTAEVAYKDFLALVHPPRVDAAVQQVWQRLRRVFALTMRPPERSQNTESRARRLRV